MKTTTKTVAERTAAGEFDYSDELADALTKAMRGGASIATILKALRDAHEEETTVDDEQVPGATGMQYVLDTAFEQAAETEETEEEDEDDE